MECATHTGEKVFVVCKSCDKFPFVCGVCLEEEHAEHKVQTLRNAAQSICQNLEQVETENVHVFKEIESDLDGLTEIREDLKQDASNIDDEIAKRADIIRSKIDEVSTAVIQKQKTEVGKNAEAIDITEEALTQQVSKIDMFKLEVAKLQKMNDYADVIKTGRDVEVPDTNRIPRPDIQALTFIPGTVRDGELKRMFGDIKGAFDNGSNDAAATDDRAEGNDDKTNMSDFVGSIKREAFIKVTPIASFNHPTHDVIDAIFCPGSGTGLWKFQDKNSVKLCNRSGNIKEAINLGTKSQGFTVTSDNRLLFCCTSQQCIKEMKLPNGDITEKFSTSPLQPNFICTGPSGDIYVTMYDKHDYDVTDDSTRVLDRYDSRGLNKTQCQVDGNGRNIFVVPGKVCVDRSGTRVAVINRINARRSELVVLDKYLSPILIYTGPSVLTGDALAGHVLSGVVFDTRDNIWVAECYSKTVQLLSPTGEPLQVLLTMETSPSSLSMHRDEVWVGDGEGKVQIFRYSY